MPTPRITRPRASRSLAIAFAVLAGASIMAACSRVASAPKGTRGATSTSSSTVAPSSSSTSTSSPSPTALKVGLTTFYWKNSAASTLNPIKNDGFIAGRILTTEVRYPTLDGSANTENVGAEPARDRGPFPVIVFAHGFDMSPWYYKPLLDSWVRAGFIVVSPIFPDANTQVVTKLGGPLSPRGMWAENDIAYEPGDIVFVLKQFDAAAAENSGTLVAGIANLSDVALAGQSDGANVVGALAYGSDYTKVFAQMPIMPRAVVILSGQKLNPYVGPPNNYSSSESSPPVLQVQSNTDTCNYAQLGANLYKTLMNAPVHLFETLYGASHIQPYTALVPGPNPYAPVVDKVTTEFLELELGWHAVGLSISAIEKAGSVAGVSQLSPAYQGFPNSPTSGGCGTLPRG
ncbi:MAG: alpha/beta hydrolase [Acidimicrobiales bacterium]